MSFPKPRYEARQVSGALWSVFDNDRSEVVFGTEETTLRVATATAAALNREYQRWLTDSFYKRATEKGENQ